MKRLVIVIIIIVIIVAGVLYYFLKNPGGNIPSDSRNPGSLGGQAAQKGEFMKITSPAFGHNQNMPSQFTCDGANTNPALEFSDVPEGTVSLALIMDDPDAPAGIWAHWLLWNIPPTTLSIPENSAPPSAVQGITDFGQAKYGGPCPPSGIHRYFFKLYALDAMLVLPPSSTKKALESAMAGHVLADAEMIGLYQRGK